MSRPKTAAIHGRDTVRPAASLAVGAVAVAVLLGACAGGGGTSGHNSRPPAAVSAATIVIKNFSFQPASLTVTPGATVTVRNEDPATHTVTALNKAFDTGDINGGTTATFTAPTTPGSYPYICMIHQFMHAVLTVS